MGCRQYRFVAMVIVASVMMSLPRKVESATTGQNISDTDKAHLIADYFINHDSVSHYVYDSAMAGVNLYQHLSPGNTSTDPGLVKAMANYALTSTPDLLRNTIFQDIVKVLVDEAGKAFRRSNVTIDPNKPIPNTAVQQIIAKFNFVGALTQSITIARPLIEQYRHDNDSRLFIMALNKAIEVTAYGISTPTFRTVVDIFVDELYQGFQKSGLLKRIDTEGPGFLNNNNNTLPIVRSVVSHSNLPRLTMRVYNASKPVLDNLYGGDTEFVYAGLLTAFGAATRVRQDPRFQFLFKIFQSEFFKTYNKTDQSKGEAYLLGNPVNTYLGVLQSMNVRSLIETVLGSVSASILMPYNSSAEADPISETCYEDTIDFLDAVKAEKAWALKMVDSYGKVPAGLEKGNINFIGSFDQCLEVRSDIKAGEVLGSIRRSGPRYPRSVGSKYCRVRIPVPQSVVDGLGLDTKGISLKVTWGVCVPNTCAGSDIYGLLKLNVFRNYTSLVESVDCSEDLDVTQDLAAVLAIIILSIFAFLMLIGTLYVSMETRGVFAENDQSSKADSAYSNLAYTKDEDTKHYETLDVAKAENGQALKTLGKPNGSGLPSNYVPHAESKQHDSDIPFTAIEEKSNGVSHGEVGTKNELQKQDTARQQRKKKEGVLVSIAKAFSVQINAPKILTGKTGLNSINCIHGIRFFSITWIMLGHTYNYGLISSASESWSTANFVEALSIIQRFTFQAVVAGGFSVDTFYMMSGMLLTYIQLKQMAKLKAHPTGPKIGNYVLRYFFHRFWRLTPMYGMVLLIYATLIKYIGHGPLWPNAVETSENCKDSWWTNILYINNLVNVDKQCMAWTWFLANDMQFYIISVVLLFFLTMSLPIGIIISTMLLMVGIATAIWKEYVYNGNFFTMKSDGGDYWNNVYITPWCRVGAYCVGLFLGIVFYKRPRKAFSKAIGFIGWATATAVALALVYSTYSTNKKGGVVWTNVQNAIYEGVGRPVWSLCVAWVIFACHNDMGGHVNSILSWKGLVPLSRLSYAAYLLHPMMMILHVYSKRSLVYLTDYDIIYLFLGHATMSFMGAFVVSIAFEAPFMALEKLIL